MSGLTQLLRNRFGIGLLILVGALLIGSLLRAMGFANVPLYWTMFVASMAGTLLALGLGDNIAVITGKKSPSDSLRRVLFLEYEMALEQAFAASLRSHGAVIDALVFSEASRPGRIRNNYDLVIADANIPYGVLVELKSAVDTKRQVFVVAQFPRGYPSGAPWFRTVEIIETIGPPDLRREVEDVLSAAPI